MQQQQQQQMSTEHFTQALLVTHGYHPGQVTTRERLDAEHYLMQLRDSPDGLNLSFHIISNEPVNEIRCFWAFNTVIHHLPTIAMTVDAAQAEELYRTLFSFIYRYLFSSSLPNQAGGGSGSSSVGASSSTTTTTTTTTTIGGSTAASPTATAPADYLVNKHAQLMVVSLQEFFPHRWRTFFTDLFDLLAHSSNSNTNTNTNNNNNTNTNNGLSLSPSPLFSSTAATVTPTATTNAVTLYFLRIFEYIDERVVRVRDRTDRDRQQRQRDTQLKDAMREHVIPRALQAWYSVLCDCRLRAPELAKVCLAVLQTYIEWIDVMQLMSPEWINLLYYLVTVPDLRVGASACMHSLVEKKQLPGTKMHCLATLNVVDSLPRIVAMLDVPPARGEDVMFIDSVAKLVVSVAEQFLSLLETVNSTLQQQQQLGTCGEAVVASMMVMTDSGESLLVHDKPFEITQELLDGLSSALHTAISQLLRLLKIDLYEVLDILLPFIQILVKTPTTLREQEASELLFMLFYRTRILGMTEGDDRIWEDAVVDQRKTLHNLIRLLHRRNSGLVMQHLILLVSVITGGLDSVLDNSYDLSNSSLRCGGGTIGSGSGGNAGNLQQQQFSDSRCTFNTIFMSTTGTSYGNGDDVQAARALMMSEVSKFDFAEAVLRFFYEVGEAIKLDCLRDPDDMFSQMFVQLLTCDAIVLQCTCSCVHLTFFEVMDRYSIFFTYHKEFIPVLLHRFLLVPSGIANPNDKARARICYLFGHMLQVLKPCLLTYAPDMVRALQTIVASTPCVLLPSDCREMYEAMGTLIGIILSSAVSSSSSSSFQLVNGAGGGGGDAAAVISLSCEIAAFSGDQNGGGCTAGDASLKPEACATTSDEEAIQMVSTIVQDTVKTLMRQASSDKVGSSSSGGGGGYDTNVANHISYLSALAKGMSASVLPTSNSGDAGSSRSASVDGSSPVSISASTTAAPTAVQQAVIALFASATEQVMHVVRTWRTSSVVRDRGGHYFHQMVNTIPFDVIAPYFDTYVRECLDAMEAVPELGKLLRLMLQLVNKAGARGVDMVTQLTPCVWSKVCELGELAESSPVVSMGVVSECSREKLDVYRQLSAYMFSVATWGCAAAVLQIPHAQLQGILRQFTFAVTLPTDLDLPKSSIQTVTKLVLECCAEEQVALLSELAVRMPEVEANYVLLRTFVLSEFIPTVLRTISACQFDLKDAKNFLIIGEFSQLCKAAVQRFGEAAMEAIYSELCSVIGPEGARQFCIGVRDQPRFTTTMKVQLKAMLEQSQQQQQW